MTNSFVVYEIVQLHMHFIGTIQLTRVPLIIMVSVHQSTNRMVLYVASEYDDCEAD